MNILFLDQFSDPGGAQRCLADLLPAIRQRGWRATVAAPGHGRLRDLAAPHGEYRELRGGSYGSGSKSARDVARFVSEIPRLAREIDRLIRETEADLLYVNGPRLMPAAAGARIPVLFHAHSHLPKRYAAALTGLSIASAGATVVAICNYVAEPLRLYAPGRRITVAYNGVEDGFPRLPRAGPPRIGVIGRIAPEKGQLDFVEAVRMLPRDWSYLVCGAPLFSDAAALRYFDRVKSAAEGLPVAFPGWTDDARAVLAGLDLLVVPSRAEPGTTRVILEAYAAGVPVVATRSGGIPEILAGGETGFLTSPGDPAALARSIRDAMSRDLTAVVARARRAWQENFTLERYQSRILNILEKVGASARR
jgi:glycosyltransferase involved in cell wall biosynthesis